MAPTINEIQQQADAEWMQLGGSGETHLVEAFGGMYPAEYAAIRQRVGILHLPQRGVLRLTGPDRQDFLHRMCSQNVNAMQGGQTSRAFQLNEKGRILADITVHHGESDTWLEMDRMDVAAVHELLDARHFVEDLTIEDFSPRREVFAVMGPAAVALLAKLHEAGTAIGEMEPNTHHVVTLAGVAGVTAYRWDDVGETALRLLVPVEDAGALYAAMLEAAGFEPGADAEADAAYAERRRATLRGRPVGWAAYNTARIEAGTVLFHVDFGPDSLPAETGLEDAAVDFSKGCYTGQEIVARMRNLGHPKRVIVSLRMEDDALPIAGTEVFDLPDESHAAGTLGGEVVGGVTSSAVSPLLSNRAVGFATLKWGKHEPGTEVRIVAEGQPRSATVLGPPGAVAQAVGGGV